MNKSIMFLTLMFTGLISLENTTNAGLVGDILDPYDDGYYYDGYYHRHHWRAERERDLDLRERELAVKEKELGLR